VLDPMTYSTPLTPEILVPRLGDALVEKGLISSDQKRTALEYQARLRLESKNMTFGQILVELGFVDRQALDEIVTEQIISLRAALQDANRNLERRVEQRTAELQLALEKLSELNQLKANFVSNISHELRTPLTHIKGYLDLFITQDLGPVNPEQERALQVMQRSSDRLEREIEDLILFSTAERGEISLHLTRFHIASLCQAVIQRVLSKALEKKINIEIQTSDPQALVFGDEDKTGWVLMQLLDNAVKFSPDNRPILVKLTTESSFIRVSVIDTGIGIPKDRLEEIFEPFHQLDNSSTRRYGGTGLGLTLARKIMEAHGSFIHVHSIEGQGSVFEILLKRAEPG
jgi:signal transduction histidine kinase